MSWDLPQLPPLPLAWGPSSLQDNHSLTEGQPGSSSRDSGMGQGLKSWPLIFLPCFSQQTDLSVLDATLLPTKSSPLA